MTVTTFAELRRRQHPAFLAASRLHPAATARGGRWCVPVALAALTGLPPAAWPELPTEAEAIAALAAAGFRADPLPPADPSRAGPIGGALASFGDPRGVAPGLAPPPGAFLVIADDYGPDAAHAVAVSIVRQGGRRFAVLADNHNRAPVSLASLRRRAPYAAMRVTAAWRVAPLAAKGEGA